MAGGAYHSYASTLSEGSGSGIPGGTVGSIEWNSALPVFSDVVSTTASTFVINAAGHLGALLLFAGTGVTVSLAAPTNAAPSAGNVSNFYKGWWCQVKNSGTGVVTITPTASTIDGAASYVLNTGDEIEIYSDGNNYQVTHGAFNTVDGGTF